MKVYLCGPINGRSDGDCTVWREYVKSRLPDTLDPMRRDWRGQENEHWREIIELDKLDVAACDALLVYFDRPSVGASMEMIWAWQRGKRIVLVNKSDKPLSPWLRYHSHHIVQSLDDACDLLAAEQGEANGR